MRVFFVLLVGLVFGALASGGGVEVAIVHGRPHCTVTAKGNKQSDVDNILNAFDHAEIRGASYFLRSRTIGLIRS